MSTKDGDVTKLEVKAVGKPKPEGKWKKDGNEIKPSNEFVIENFDDGTSILTITEVYPDDTGEIVYEAHNPLGVAITTTLLSVNEGNNIYCCCNYYFNISSLVPVFISNFYAFQDSTINIIFLSGSSGIYYCYYPFQELYNSCLLLC